MGNPNCPRCDTRMDMVKMKHPAREFPQVGVSRYWVCQKCRGKESIWDRLKATINTPKWCWKVGGEVIRR